MRNAVCNIGELFRSEIIVAVENCIFKNLTVERRNAVNAVAGGNAKVRHSYNAAGNYRKLLNLACIVSHFPDVGAVSVVNFLDYLINTRKKRLNKTLRPAFKGFLHNGMVCVCTGGGNNFPCVVPAVAAFIKKNTHKLRNGERGVGVVDMNGILFRKVFHC